MANKYLDYAGLQRLVENIDRKYAPISAIVFKSTVEDIAHLPALNTQKAGYMYNIKVGGLTTDDFVEGAGHIVADGENIAAVELLTGNFTPVGTPAATDDPKALGWYEVDQVNYVDVTATLDPSANPQALGLYEEDSLNPGQYILTSDTSIVALKAYYEKEVTYKLSQDRLPVAGKDYFTADTVMKWDLMGGVFDLEDRYLEFGDTFPQGPASRMTNGRTFLYMGDDVKEFKVVVEPEGRPADNGYFELDSATAVTDRSTIFNPKQQGLYEACDFFKVELAGTEDPSALGLYEEDLSDPTGYSLTADTTVTPGKDYFKNIAGGYVLSQDQTDDNTKTYYVCEFVASADASVDPTKIYYTESDLYKKAVIYQYDATAHDWVAQSTGGSGDFEPITNKEIDDLFI